MVNHDGKVIFIEKRSYIDGYLIELGIEYGHYLGESAIAYLTPEEAEQLANELLSLAQDIREKEDNK